MRIRSLLATGAVTAAASLTALTLGITPAPAATGVTSETGTVNITCAFTTLSQTAYWYFPSGTPKGLVWVQHGFVRSAANVADLATHYAQAGYVVFTPTLPSANIYGCTEENLGNNTDFLNNVASLFGNAANPSGQLAKSFAAAAGKAGRSGLTLPTNWVFAGHSAGGEAVEYVTNRIRTTYPAAFAGLRGVVLLDPVKSVTGSNTDTSLNGLNATSLPILTISSPPILCNSSGGGTTSVQSDLHRPFVGVRLTNGEHTDAEGASTDAVGELACGTPQAVNVAALQGLAVGWGTDFFNGTTTATYYPGGSYYQGLLSAGTIQTLAGAS